MPSQIPHPLSESVLQALSSQELLAYAIRAQEWHRLAVQLTVQVTQATDELDKVRSLLGKVMTSVEQSGLQVKVRKGKLDIPGQQYIPELFEQLKELVGDLAVSTDAGGSAKESGGTSTEAAVTTAPVSGGVTAKKPDGRTVSKHSRGGKKAIPKNLEETKTVREFGSPTTADGTPNEIEKEVVVDQQIHTTLGKVTAEVTINRFYKGYQSRLDDVAAKAAPPRLLPETLVADDALATLICQRYAELTPLYRIEEGLAGLGWPLSRGAISQHLMAAADRLDGIASALHTAITVSGVIHLDDTPWNVIMPETDDQGQVSFERHGVAHQARFFAIRSGDLTLYHYAPNKKGQQIVDFLKDYRGTLVCDEYRGNLAAITILNLKTAHCWAHVQTKIKNSGDHKYGLRLQSLIRQLYDIETATKEWTPESRAAYRREHAGPIIDEFMRLAQEAVQDYTPKHPLAVACAYALRLQKGLRTYLEDGRVPIDNNPIEHSFRPVAISRRNSLFSYCERGARASALFLSLVQSCRQLKVNPHDYLCWLFHRVASDICLDWSTVLPTSFAALHRTATAA